MARPLYGCKDAPMDAASLLADWESRGSRRDLAGHRIFVVDAPAAEESGRPPLLVLHGFPTSSVDWAPVLPALSRDRRVVLFDFLGYGLSEKPDQRYSLFEQADLVEAVAAACGLTTVDLVSHDMGDSVAGEVLARSLDGALPFSIERRVLTNGSVYIDMAQLTDGQKLLLSLPDEKLPEALVDAAGMAEALRGTLAPGSDVDEAHLLAAAEAVCRDEGAQVLPRTIRYVEERHEHEQRWTGAIETHPAPLTVVWGTEDPVAVVAMVDVLAERCPGAAVTRLGGVGHYPMIEAPGPFAEAVRAGLS
jgi:pimeloyl-ACP methyl ester carboxylesterase